MVAVKKYVEKLIENYVKWYRIMQTTRDPKLKRIARMQVGRYRRILPKYGVDPDEVVRRLINN